MRTHVRFGYYEQNTRIHDALQAYSSAGTLQLQMHAFKAIDTLQNDTIETNMLHAVDVMSSV